MDNMNILEDIKRLRNGALTDDPGLFKLIGLEVSRRNEV